jgi:GntR family transcriptional regulator, carbon starvation induced regulator
MIEMSELLEFETDAALAAQSDDTRPTLIERIRDDILTCRLPPGTRLQTDDVRARYSSGISQVREALMRLEAEDLVVFVQNKGFRVAPVSEAQLRDLNQIRTDLEGIALRRSIKNGNVEWEAEFVASYHRLSRQSKFAPGSNRQISEAWSREHRIFHMSLISACGSPILKSILRNLYDQAERYIVLAASRRSTPKSDLIGHEAIMKAVLARDADKACELSRLHIDLTLGAATPRSDDQRSSLREARAGRR